MRKFRILSLVLALLMLLGVLAACSKPSEDGPVTDGDVESESGSGSGDGAPTPYMDDFGGYKFRVLSRGAGGWKSYDITGEVIGTTVSMATYKRNEQLKNKYNFEVVEDRQTDWLSKAQTVGESGQDVYDMWSFKMNDMPSLGQEGYLYNLNEVDGINLDAPYYDQTTRQQGSFADYLFFLTGDLLYQDDASAVAMVFNVSLWDKLKLGDVYGKNVYELVESKEWTLERLSTLAKLGTFDDGDGEWDHDDTWGCTYENVNILTFNIGLGNDLLQKDEDDLFVLNQETKQVNDLESIFTFFNSGSCTTKSGDYGNIFYKGRALFSAVWVGELPTQLPASGVDYGVAPMPLKDSEQENYRSMISTYGSNCITICSTVKDVDKVASIIELLSYESMTTLTPALQEWMFEGRGIMHAEDLKMVDIIMDGKTYELCYLWSTGALYSTMISLNNANGAGITSTIDGCKGAVEASVARKLERLNQLS